MVLAEMHAAFQEQRFGSLSWAVRRPSRDIVRRGGRFVNAKELGREDCFRNVEFGDL